MKTMVHAKPKKETQVNLLAEAVNCSGFQVNVILKVDLNKPDTEAWTGNSVRNWFNNLMKSGRIGYFAKEDNTKGKITERGFPAIMVEYVENSATGTY